MKDFDKLLTLYGRKPVLEALQNEDIPVFRLHLARDNRSSHTLEQILALAEKRRVDVRRHTRLALSRISGNSRQDQGVAIDVIPPQYLPLVALPAQQRNMELIALDGVTNPRNLGMIIRSVAASPATGLVLPRRGCARLDALVIKASAGTLLRSRIYHCEELPGGLDYLLDAGFEIVGLSSDGDVDIKDITDTGRRVLILGGETRGLSTQASARCHRVARIPLDGGVESLNVAAAAAIVAFRSLFRHD